MKLKKMIAILSAAAMLETCAMMPVNAELGDVDNDQLVDAVDAVEILLAAANLGVGNETEITTESGDADGDGAVTAYDASYLLRYSADVGSGAFSGTLEEFMKTCLASTQSETAVSLKADQITVTMEELEATNYQVPVWISLDKNAGISAFEFGVSADSRVSYEVAEYRTAFRMAGSPENFIYPDTTRADIYNTTWITWADSSADTQMTNLALLLVTLPEDASQGEKYDITLLTENFEAKAKFGDMSQGVSYQLQTTDGWIQIDGEPLPTETETETDTENETQPDTEPDTETESESEEDHTVQDDVEENVAYLNFVDGGWWPTYQGFVDGYEHLTPIKAEITGNGSYTVGVSAEALGEEAIAEAVSGVEFMAVIIPWMEANYPGAVITIDSIMMDDTEIAMTAKNYTSSDDGFELRSNIYNMWIGGIPEDARSTEGQLSELENADEYGWMIINPDDFKSWTTVTVNFTISGMPFDKDEAQQDFVQGDADSNGKVDILDVITINKAIMGKESITDTQLKAIDFNGNGKPDSEESLTLLKYIVGLISDFGM